MLILSESGDLLGSKLWVIFKISFWENVTDAESSLTEKTIEEVYFKYTLSILHLYLRYLKSNRSML